MGSNDHVPVPDPTPRVHVPIPPKIDPRSYGALNHPVATPKPGPIGGPTTSSERLDNLESRINTKDVPLASSAEAADHRNRLDAVKEDIRMLATVSDQRLTSLEKREERHDTLPSGSLLNDRLTRLERGRERLDAQAVALRNVNAELLSSVSELQRLLQQAIRGVERLAQGHSKGNLGLPTAEDWAPHDTTL